jgi:hypothetical protein
MTAKPPLPQLPGGPNPAEPVPRTAVDGVGLEAFAEISASLAARIETRAAVLARAGLSEPRWIAVETTWMLRIAAALMQQDPSLGQDYDALFREAMERLRR